MTKCSRCKFQNDRWPQFDYCSFCKRLRAEQHVGNRINSKHKRHNYKFKESK